MLLGGNKKMKIYVAHSKKIDFEKDLYKPMKESDICKNNEVFFPHDEIGKNVKTKDIIKNADLVIAEISENAVGLGIELGWADCFNTTILCIYKKGAIFSQSIKFITNNFIEYENKEDMINKIQNFIKGKE